MKPTFKAKLDAAIQSRAIAAAMLEPTLSAQIRASEIALRTFVDTRIRDARVLVTNLFKNDEGVSRIVIAVRDRDHFYRLVNYCNKTYGKGSDKWTVCGRVLKFVDPTKHAYNPPAYKIWKVMKPGLNLSHLLSI